ncbi:IclR family transcriptional regulator [Streptomyces spirodelae]|uniref:IclR family transcriptional regulator n=1 Tax=Streptomyces spirodelae TaxID=2812904 RepID=A0ABS3WQ29_9ACTN|nr:IclR family transcriptional regulator [Streptomyces spirodelae]MBO8185218.1 IclR family transcriptional regulator [Streptomyces spirodelae]
MSEEHHQSGSADLGRRPGTLERGLAILELLGTERSLSAAQVAERLDLSRSATYRILGTLRQRGYVDWDGNADDIVLGQRTVTLGMAALSGFDPFLAAQAHLRDLSRELSEAALMAVRDGDQMVYIAHEDVTDHSIAVRRLLGVRRDLHSTSLGKAYLAALPLDEADALVDRIPLPAYTPTTLTDPARLRAELDETRARGFSIDDSENEPDVLCFGAPIRDERGWPLCAISVAGPRERMLGKQDMAAQRVAEVALAISRRLGFVGQANAVDFGGSS